jgi:hypothetical protein
VSHPAKQIVWWALLALAGASAAGGVGDVPVSDPTLPTHGREPSACVPAWTLQCQTWDVYSNYGPGSTDEVTSYSCWPTNSETGPEYTYSFTTPSTDAVTLDLVDLLADLDLFVLTAPGGVCSGANCIAFSVNSEVFPESITFTASAGVEYFLVVDGYEDAESTYRISASCSLLFRDGFESGGTGAWSAVWP